MDIQLPAENIYWSWTIFTRPENAQMGFLPVVKGWTDWKNENKTVRFRQPLRSWTYVTEIQKAGYHIALTTFDYLSTLVKNMPPRVLFFKPPYHSTILIV